MAKTLENTKHYENERRAAIKAGFVSLIGHGIGLPARGIKQCLEYSDEPVKLEDWINDNDVQVRLAGILPWQAGNNELHLTFDIKINKGEPFRFHCSAVDTAAWLGEPSPLLRPRVIADIAAAKSKARFGMAKAQDDIIAALLYSVLCCVRSDINTPISFKEFCDDFGGDIDSIKSKAQWEACLTQRAILEASGIAVDAGEYFPG